MGAMIAMASALAENLTVSPQVTAADIQGLADAGVTVLVNNRPDGEEPGQMTAADAKALAEAAGMTYVHLPVASGAFTQEHIDGLATVLAAPDAKVHMHCRSGTRSTVLWSLLQVREGRLSVTEAMDHAAKAGFDIRGAQPLLEAQVH